MRDKLRELIDQVATHFPGSRVEHKGSDVVLLGTIYLAETYLPETNGAGIQFFQQHNETKIRISGVWPAAITKDREGYDRREILSPYEGTPNITVSVTRDAKGIANDIKRKFIPAYLPLYEKQYETKVRIEEYSAKNEITKAITDEMNKHSYVSATPCGDRIDLKLNNLTRDQAVILFNSFKKLTQD